MKRFAAKLDLKYDFNIVKEIYVIFSLQEWDEIKLLF